MKITYKHAINNLKSNPSSYWSESGEKLIKSQFPIVWPNHRVKFKINTDANIFTIGSCFARNIERHLGNNGFYLPVMVFAKELLEYSEQQWPGNLSLQEEVKKIKYNVVSV